MHRFFVSHTSADKPIARRVARRLHACGMPAWMDERELRPGDPLTASIRSQLAACDTVVVIASAAAAAAPWVRLELAFARALQPAKRVLPLFIERVMTDPLFADDLGIDATDRHAFEHVVLRVAAAACDGPLPAQAAEPLRAGLAEVAREEPGLALLIDACTGGTGLPLTQLESVAALPFHPLDYALNALHDLPDAPRELVAFHAAHLFRRAGVGAYALERHVESSRAPTVVLSLAVGQRLQAPELAPALHLLSRSRTPDDQALAGFIEANGDALAPAHWRAVVRLVTSPPRTPPGFIVDAAFAALRDQPASADLAAVWERWIVDGCFDDLVAGASTPRELARWLGEAHGRGLAGWERITDALVGHVRRLARSKDRARVQAAVEHVIAASEHNPALLSRVAAECDAAPGTAEWDGWPLAREMAIYVHAFTQAAHTDRDWLRAVTDYENGWRAVQWVAERRARAGQTPPT